MAIETFIWVPDDEADVDGTLRTRNRRWVCAGVGRRPQWRAKAGR